MFVPAGTQLIAAVLQRPTATSPLNAGSGAVPLAPPRSTRFWIAVLATNPFPASEEPALM